MTSSKILMTSSINIEKIEFWSEQVFNVIWS